MSQQTVFLIRVPSLGEKMQGEKKVALSESSLSLELAGDATGLKCDAVNMSTMK